MRISKCIFFAIIAIFFQGNYDMVMAAHKVNTENNQYEVNLISREKHEEGSNQYKFTFSVENKLTQQKSLIEMKNMTTEIEEISIVKNRLIIFGYVNNDAAGVTLIDLKKNEEMDFILCFSPVFSESKRFLIYEKFRPRFAPEEVQSDLVLLYDLTKSPEDNRLQNNYKNIKKKSKRIGDPEYLTASENVGVPLYPEKNVSEQIYFVWVPTIEERHFVRGLGIYLWLEQDKKVVFLDRYKGDNWLVSVDLTKGLDKVEIKKKIIDVSSILVLDPKTPDYEKLLKKEKERFAVTELKRGKDNIVKFVLKKDIRYNVTEFEMVLP